MNDPLAVLTTPLPALSRSSAAELLQSRYGIAGKLELQESERDQNFRVRQPGGESCILKIANSAESFEVTDFQNKALLHIESIAPDFPVPRLIPTLAGEETTIYLADDGENHTVRVLSWLEGMPLRLAQQPPDIAFNLGENLAQLGIALKGFQHPASNYSLLWDVKRADNLRPLVAHITDKNIRQLCVQQLENFTQTVKPALSDVRWQVIFNDLHSSNVLVDEREGRVFAGIIDFGDMLRSPLVADVAVAIAYLCGEGGNALQNISKFLRGYASVTPLDEPEIALLYPLMLMRNCMTVLISSWRASIYPENVEYILESNKRAHRTIDVLSGMGYEKVTDEFHSACADSGGLV